MWYGGQIGDIFRIINSSTMRYRRVIKALPEPKSKKVKNNSGKFSNVTANKYYKAHNSVIQMLLDRQRESESDSKLDSSLILNKFRKSYENVQTYFTQDNLYEMNIGEHETIMNKRGKRMFVLYLKRNDDRMLGNKKSAFYSMAQDTINEIIDIYNADSSGIRNMSHLNKPDINKPYSVDSVACARRIEVIVIFNNDGNITPVTTKIPSIPYMQFIALQSIPMPLPQHIEQPEFTILNPLNSSDREEIRDIYNMQGLKLDTTKTLLDYNIKANTKLLFL